MLDMLYNAMKLCIPVSVPTFCSTPHQGWQPSQAVTALRRSPAANWF